MAIAPLLDTEAADWSGSWFDARWPRPALQVVPRRDEPDDTTEVVRGGAVPQHLSDPLGACAVAFPVRSGLEVGHRRARRATIRRRRRAVVLGILVAGLVCGLALPLASLGGSPVVAHPQGQVAVAGETIYVVRPGDTLWSIAERFDRGGNPRPMAEALSSEIGSVVVVPGERVAIP